MKTNNTEELILFSIDKISQINRILLWDIIKKDHNLGKDIQSPIQIQFIDYINKMPRQLRTVSYIAKEFELKKSTVSGSINNLIDKGYLEKDPDENDKRVFHLKTTQKCREELVLIDDKNKSLINIIKKIPEYEKKIVLNFFMNMMKELYDKNLMAQFRICLTCVNYNKESPDNKSYYCSLLDEFIDDSQIRTSCTSYKEEYKKF
jgi:DNA-binding MarR family transcriptional regulator